jgi:hypothetical protein
MEYTVEITIPESRDDVFLAIFDVLVSDPNPIAAVGEMKTSGPPSHFVIALDAADAHQAISEGVRLFRAAVQRSGVEAIADTTITGLHAERVSAEELRRTDELQPA